MNSTDTQSMLVGDAAGGDVGALEKLLSLHYPSLLSYAQRHTPSELRREIDPEDVIQDTVFEAIRRIRELRSLDPRSLQAWLFTIARHRIGQLLRFHRSLKRGAGKTVNEAELDAGEAVVINLLQDLALYERTPSQSALAHELVLRLEDGLARLDIDQRQVLRMRYMQCLSVPEVASALNRTEGAVRMVCMRGLKALRVLLISASRVDEPH
jgi:RNA polymerase sigma-70 factor, ECF subfamily